MAAGAGGSSGAGLSSAAHPAWWTLTGLGVVVLALGLLASGTRATQSARRTAAKLEPSPLGPVTP